MDFPQIATDYWTYLKQERNASPATIHAYISDLRKLYDWAQEQGIEFRAPNFTLPVARAYLSYLHEEGLAPATISRRIHALRSIWQFAVDSEYIPSNPWKRLTLPKKVQRVPVCMQPAEIEAMVKGANAGFYSETSIRDASVLVLLVHTGLRRQELLDLQLGDCDLGARVLTVRKGKGGKARLIPLTDTAVRAIEEYLEVRPKVDHSHLFCSRQGGRMNKDSLTNAFHEALRRAGISRSLSLHKLRSTFATRLLLAGAPLTSIQLLLGHESITTTASAYLAVDLETLRKAVELGE